eukprot:GFUD01021094.1.p1 GENE.GFUD01021094.1~~GFUD01021094.1.p1  ORF type:complete len:574 (+),score=138.69 GFUD01021094.1:68-1789(+)
METESVDNEVPDLTQEAVTSHLLYQPHTSSSCSPHTELIFSSLSSPPDQPSAVTVTNTSSSPFIFSAQKLLLASASPLLRHLLADSQTDSISLVLPDFSSPSLQLLEQFLMTGEIICQSKSEYTSCHQLLETLQLLPEFYKPELRSGPVKLEFGVRRKVEGDVNGNSNDRNESKVTQKESSCDTETSLDYDENEQHWDDSNFAVPSPVKHNRNGSKKFKIKSVVTGEDLVKLPCPYCGKTFNKGVRFNIHLRKHEGLKPYVCDVCNKEFDNKSTFFNHKKSHLDESNKSVCDVCGGHYKDAHVLKVHVQTQHLMVEKPFTCDVCGDKFKTKGSLKIHSSKHEEDRAFVCDECGFQTKNKWLLKAHIKTHKTVKDFQCPHCPKTFNFQFILDKHIRIHTNERPFPCETCGTSFVSGIHLRRHQKSVHKTVRDFVCNICSAPFKRLSELKRHIILHSNERPFECKVCGETFKHREAGRRHSKSTHPGTAGSITYKPTDTIGELATFAIKKLSAEEISKAGLVRDPPQVDINQCSQIRSHQTVLVEEISSRVDNNEYTKKEFLERFVQNHPKSFVI